MGLAAKFIIEGAYELVKGGKLLPGDLPGFIKTALEAAGFEANLSVEFAAKLGIGKDELAKALASVGEGGTWKRLAVALGRNPKDIEEAATALGKKPEELLDGLRGDAAKDAANASSRTVANDAGFAWDKATSKFSKSQWEKLRVAAADPAQRIDPKMLAKATEAEAEELQRLSNLSALAKSTIPTAAKAANSSYSWLPRLPVKTLLLGGGGVAIYEGVKHHAFNSALNLPQIMANTGPDTALAAGHAASAVAANAAGDKERAYREEILAGKGVFDVGAIDIKVYNGIKSGINWVLSLILPEGISEAVAGFFAMLLVQPLKPIIHAAFSKYIYPVTRAIAGKFGMDTSEWPDLSAPDLTADQIRRLDTPVNVDAAKMQGHAEELADWQDMLARNKNLSQFNGERHADTLEDTVIATKKMLHAANPGNPYYAGLGHFDGKVNAGLLDALRDFSNDSVNQDPKSRAAAGRMLAALSEASGLPLPPGVAPAAPTPLPPARETSQPRDNGSVQTDPQFVPKFLQAALHVPVTGNLDDNSILMPRAVAGAQDRLIKAGLLKESDIAMGTLDQNTAQALANEFHANFQHNHPEIQGEQFERQLEQAALATIAAQEALDKARAVAAAPGTHAPASPAHNPPSPVAPSTAAAPAALPGAASTDRPVAPAAAPLPVLPPEQSPTLLQKADDVSRTVGDGVLKTLSFGFVDRATLGGLVDSLAAGDIDWKTGEVRHIEENTRMERAKMERARQELGEGAGKAEAAGMVGGMAIMGIPRAALSIFNGLKLGNFVKSGLGVWMGVDTVKAAAAEIKPLNTPVVPANPQPTAQQTQ